MAAGRLRGRRISDRLVLPSAGVSDLSMSGQHLPDAEVSHPRSITVLPSLHRCRNGLLNEQYQAADDNRQLHLKSSSFGGAKKEQTKLRHLSDAADRLI